jgi:transposase
MCALRRPRFAGGAKRRDASPELFVGMIEVEVDGVTIRANRDADANTIAAIVQALKASR